jgi:hypothetical protein
VQLCIEEFQINGLRGHNKEAAATKIYLFFAFINWGLGVIRNNIGKLYLFLFGKIIFLCCEYCKEKIVIGS